jgi:hypothetical protein
MEKTLLSQGIQFDHVLVVSDIMEYTTIIAYQHREFRLTDVSEIFHFHVTLTFDHTWNDNGMWFVFRHGFDGIILPTTTVGNHCDTTENHAHSEQHTLLH